MKAILTSPSNFHSVEQNVTLLVLDEYRPSWGQACASAYIRIVFSTVVKHKLMKEW